MSTESTPPPPPPPSGEENLAPQAPKLKLTRPASAVPPVAPVAAAGNAFAPPPPPPPAPATEAPPVARVTAPTPSVRPLPSTGSGNRGNVGKIAATVDVLALAASISLSVILALELFSKTKG